MLHMLLLVKKNPAILLRLRDALIDSAAPVTSQTTLNWLDIFA